MTTIINLYGWPGVGKSALVAKTFTTMKDIGYNVELVSEYVKQWAWE
jgi:nucleoside-triphosphatase THEP1